MYRSILILALAGLLQVAPSLGQSAEYTRADTLRGSDGPGRAWWDVTFYDLSVAVSPGDSSIAGSNVITYRVVAPGKELQLDLQPPMQLARVSRDGEDLPFRRDGNAWFVTLPNADPVGSLQTLSAEFHGRPRVAVRPPWDGGFQWETSSDGTPWVATSNQGLGASIWWPNKDYQGDEPDSQRVAIRVPDPLIAVSNGRLNYRESHPDGTTTYHWSVRNPINNYSISANVGAYAHWNELYPGEGGALTMDFWPLAENLSDARRQWKQARSTMACFEHWFGPYPFYEDGYKLIEVPYLGMEHQSGVTYGNGYANGYRGTDLSGTGLGLEWDFIVVHETAHEWWGNNITARDIADNWIHESFANYSESLYTECLTGSADAAEEYVIGTRTRITNQDPIIAPHGVQATPPGDMYYKGGNMLHTLRRLVDDDAKWREILRGLNHEFRHQLVSSAEIEAFLERESGLVLGPFFDQYLRDTRVPTLEWALSDGLLSFRWANVIDSFEMPVRVGVGPGRFQWIHPTAHWKFEEADLVEGSRLELDPGFYVKS
ncbi:MAG: M1 family metallopeptidase, partial [Rhodothermales bacterium]|nr:M1 family metallopeptidase [Rhodothermales bacterium]